MTNHAGAGGSYILQPDGGEALVSRTEPDPIRAPDAPAPEAHAETGEPPVIQPTPNQPAPKKKGA